MDYFVTVHQHIAGKAFFLNPVIVPVTRRFEAGNRCPGNVIQKLSGQMFRSFFPVFTLAKKCCSVCFSICFILFKKLINTRLLG